MIETTDGLARASAMLEVRRYEQAAALLAELVAAQPDDDQAWGLLARAQLGAGRYSDAAAAAGRASVLAPSDDWPYRLISKAHLHQGRPAAAVQAASEACRLAPQEWRSHLCLAQAALATETDFDVASEAAATACRIAPSEPDVHFVSGMVSLAQGDRKAARAHQERVLALDPAHSGALNELGRISLQRFGVARGARHFLQAARLAPRVSVYGFNLEVVVRRTVGLAISLATVPSCVLTYLAALLHLPRIPVVAGLAVIAVLAVTFGAVQYRRMPPELQPLFRRRHILLAAAAGYGSILVALVVAAVTPPAALPGALVAMTVLVVVARLAAFGLLRRRTSAGALPGRSTARAGNG
jgi:tetratricopeptide (TPR) repeat protein